MIDKTDNHGMSYDISQVRGKTNSYLIEAGETYDVILSSYDNELLVISTENKEDVTVSSLYELLETSIVELIN